MSCEASCFISQPLLILNRPSSLSHNTNISKVCPTKNNNKQRHSYLCVGRIYLVLKMRCAFGGVQTPAWRHITLACIPSATQHGVSHFSSLLTTHRLASTPSPGDEHTRSEVDVDAVARPMGYGPFSTTAKARVLREKTEAQNASSSSSLSPSASAHAAASTVMQNVTLQTNLSLRLSLAGLPHPSQLETWAYASPKWRLAFVRLYRTILRLHNKTVAVSLRTARGAGPEAAVSAVTGVHNAASSLSDGQEEKCVVGEGVGGRSAEADEDDYLLRYLLTPEQQEFGNRFVQGEFQRHMDADAVSASIFYASWYDYVLQLASGVTSREMTEKEKRLLSDEQKEKLNTLRGAFVDLRVAKEPQYMP